MTTIELFGDVGVDFTATSVSRSLPASGPVTVLINSGGGYAAEGAAIHALLSSHNGRVDVDIIGIAASAASLIAMAGKRITMRAGSVMMIHDPLQLTIGNSADHAKTIEELESYARAYAKVYAARAKITEARAREIMVAETWYDGPEAVAAGFADATDSITASAFASFSYEKYRHASKAMAAARAKAEADPKVQWARVISKMNGRPAPSTARSWSEALRRHNSGRL